MDDENVFALGNMTSRSPAMINRRRRILSAARRIIADLGFDGFSIRELSKRAEVSPGTLYNAFGSRENIVALAIRGYFDEFDENSLTSKEMISFDGAIECQIATTVRNMQIPKYLHTVATLYFSSSIHPAIRTVLLDIGTRFWRPWIGTVALSGELRRGVAPANLLIDLSNLQFAKVHEWSLGELTNIEFFERTIDSVLVMLMGACKGGAEAHAKVMFRKFRRSGDYRASLIEEAEKRIALTRELRTRQGAT